MVGISINQQVCMIAFILITSLITTCYSSGLDWNENPNPYTSIDSDDLFSGSGSGDDSDSKEVDQVSSAVPNEKTSIDLLKEAKVFYDKEIQELSKTISDSRKIADLMIFPFNKKFEQAINSSDSIGNEKYFSKQMLSMEGLGFSILDSNLDVDMMEFNYKTLKMEVRRNVTKGFNTLFPMNAKKNESSIQLPEKYIASISGGNETISAVFILYTKFGNSLIEYSKRANTSLNSYVIGASLSIHANLSFAKSHFVTIRLPHINRLSTGYTSTCVYWNYDTVTWDTLGCVKSNLSNLDMTVCLCDHLTNFAVLMQPYDSELSQDTVLNWITVAGSSISIICLILSLFCFFNIRQLRGVRNTIHINLSMCLLIADTTILASVFYEQGKRAKLSESVSDVPCAVMAIMLHYFYLTCFMWMGLEGFHIYRSLVVVLIKSKVRLCLYYLFGYGIPAVVVGICIILNYTYFDVGTVYGSTKSCWLSGNSGFAWSFLAFVVLILLFNAVVFFLASNAITTTKRMKPANASMILNAEQSSKWIWHLVILHPLLGLSWYLGFLQFNQFKIISYFFTICVSLQGFFIFLLHCVRNYYVQIAVKGMISRRMYSPQATESQPITTYRSSITPVSLSLCTPSTMRVSLNASNEERRALMDPKQSVSLGERKNKNSKNKEGINVGLSTDSAPVNTQTK